MYWIGRLFENHRLGASIKLALLCTGLVDCLRIIDWGIHKAGIVVYWIGRLFENHRLGASIKPALLCTGLVDCLRIIDWGQP